MSLMTRLSAGPTTRRLLDHRTRRPGRIDRRRQRGIARVAIDLPTQFGQFLFKLVQLPLQLCTIAATRQSLCLGTPHALLIGPRPPQTTAGGTERLLITRRNRCRFPFASQEQREYANDKR